MRIMNGEIQMLTSLSPITHKVYHALMKIDVSSDTLEEAKKTYTNGILCVSDCSSALNNDRMIKSTFETYNLAYEEYFVNFIRKVYEINSDKAVLIETGMNELDNVTLLRILTILDYRDKLLFLDMIKHDSKNAFVARDVRVLELLTRLATRDLLFSTFHFLSKEITVCCQPNLSFPIFVTDFSNVETYGDLAKDSNLNLCNLQIKY